MGSLLFEANQRGKGLGLNHHAQLKAALEPLNDMGSNDNP